MSHGGLLLTISDNRTALSIAVLPSQPRICLSRAARIGHTEVPNCGSLRRKTTVDTLQGAQLLNRRLFLKRSGVSLGAMALGSLLWRDQARAADNGALPGLPHFN